MEERERILKLLEEGKITADQAARLLEALGEPYRFMHKPGQDFGERIAKKIEMRLKDLPEMIERGMCFTGPGEEKKLRFEPKENLIVKSVSGDISVKGDNENSIRVRLQNGHKINTDSPDSLVIKTISGDLDLEVPFTQSIEIKAASGDLSVENLSSEITLRCGSGDADVKKIGGELRVVLGSGDLSGNELSAEVYTSLGSGDVDLAFSECRGGKIEIGSGDMRLVLPEKADIELTIAKPKRGSIVSEFDFETPEEVEEFKVTIGEPKAKLYIKTKYGDITIHKRRNS